MARPQEGAAATQCGAARSVISVAAADIYPSAGSPMTHPHRRSRLYFPFPQELVDPESLKLRLGQTILRFAALPSTEQARHLLPVEAQCPGVPLHRQFNFRLRRSDHVIDLCRRQSKLSKVFDHHRRAFRHVGSMKAKIGVTLDDGVPTG